MSRNPKTEEVVETEGTTAEETVVIPEPVITPSTIDSVKEKMEEVLSRINDDVRRECDFLLKNGGIDISSFDKDSFIPAKIVVTASLRRTVKSVLPKGREYRQTVKLLERV